MPPLGDMSLSGGKIDFFSVFQTSCPDLSLIKEIAL